VSTPSPALDPKAREELLAALRAGNTRAIAARYAALDSARLTVLLLESPDLLDEVQSAEAAAEISHVGSIAKAAKSGDWRAASFLLDRRSPPRATRAFQCGAHTKRCPHEIPWARCDEHRHRTTGCLEPEHLCDQGRGQRTGHPGTGRCWLHGGTSPHGEQLARREMAENVLASLGIPDRVDPVASLLEAVRVAAWRELGLRQMLQVRPTLFGPDHLGEGRPDVVAGMHAEALEQRAKISTMAINAGLDERIVRLAERQGEVIHRILTAALDAAGVSGEARTKAEEAVIRELVAVGPGGDELN
jgi:hypothetical protein